ncbi:MAG: DUF4954 family protein [Muribaculaceae bacterium]|nr:DUF4954 family protein [Muribaculaceae bacterium]
MKEYRKLTQQEIETLTINGCQAEDWNLVEVARGFDPKCIHRVTFYGYAKLGGCCGSIEVSDGFVKRCGINNATLRNVTIGDSCLIENVGNYMNNVIVGNGCHISNVCTIETHPNPTFGQGKLISVLNEVGKGNLLLFDGLNSQLAALMVKQFGNSAFLKALTHLVEKFIEAKRPACSTIGNKVQIINTNEITNSVIGDGCHISGASRLSDCTISSSINNPITIGTGVICENSIISGGSKIINSVKIVDCMVGEACELSNGFTAASSVFFANSYMSNGEACAAFCGPFTVSHHKSSLLIGGQFSFYNAGSATNFSNHAYKMGPMHYGLLERGTKTASGAYLLMPANIGTFSVLFGKLMYHPDTRDLPFSYLIAYSDTMYLVPGRNFATVGLYRDIRKWPKRDKRRVADRKSIVNFDWLSPFSISEVLRGKKILERLREASGDNVSTYNYHEYVIKASLLRKGIRYYDLALRIYMGAVLKRHRPVVPSSQEGEGDWVDLSGMLLPLSEEKRLVNDVIEGKLSSIEDVLERFIIIHNNYDEYRWAWTYRMILDYYNIDNLDAEAVERVHADYVAARREWISLIRKDAEKEFSLGDVEQDVLDDFVTQLESEVDFENQKLYM